MKIASGIPNGDTTIAHECVTRKSQFCTSGGRLDPVLSKADQYDVSQQDRKKRWNVPGVTPWC